MTRKSRMERIVFLDRQSLKANVRRPAFSHEWAEHAQTPEAEVADRLAGATIAITNKVPIRRATLEKLPQLKMIAVAATGYDVIDIDACRERGSRQHPQLRGAYGARTYVCDDLCIAAQPDCLP